MTNAIYMLSVSLDISLTFLLLVSCCAPLTRPLFVLSARVAFIVGERVVITICEAIKCSIINHVMKSAWMHTVCNMNLHIKVSFIKYVMHNRILIYCHYYFSFIVLF